ncbi:MAG: glycerol-3-phosphate 1-O-acyltransferase [Ignavibacteria bacterium]|nr:glycerol-3-phosphate 1-O-acyltransferase [Bacteroidota bacterium]MSQ45687.1 glycerol-3-phosphate 1-O-acyltransferase [Ignavibacteria bacterium]
MNNDLIIILISYLLGSIPTSIILSKVFGGIDIREHGSGNAGGTNVVRVLGWKIGIFVMIIDVLKGTVATAWVSQMQLVNSNTVSIFDPFMLSVICGIAAIIGHVWTIFAKFRGGKGVATGMGMMIALSPIDISVGVIIFIIIVSITKYVSVGSMFGVASIVLSIFIRKNIFNAEIQGSEILLWSTSLISLFIIFTHRANIKRLLSGTENKFSFKKK